MNRQLKHHTSVIVVSRKKTAEELMTSIKRKVDDWIETVHYPSVVELSDLSHDVATLETSVKELSNLTLTAKIQLLEKEIVGLQGDVNTANEKILELDETILLLSEQLQNLQNDFDFMKKESLLMRAKSILSAAESRFLNLLLGNCEENVRNRYPRMDLFLEEFDELDDSIQKKYTELSNYWNQKKMSFLYGRLSYSRGEDAHKQNRDPLFFRRLSPKDVRAIFSHSSFGLKNVEVDLVVGLHELTCESTENMKAN